MHLKKARVAALAAAGALTAGLGLVAAAPADAATVNTPSSCDRGAWDSVVQGTPSGVKAGAVGGDYLWHDSSGFHLRITHEAHDRRVYTGTITSSAPMRYTPVKLEKGDFVKLSDHRRVLTFAFANYGRIDGANFHTDCAASLTVSRLFVGDQAQSVDHVFLGAGKTHPAAIPFTLHRAS